MHDNDCKYSQPFFNVFANRKIKTQRTAIRSPNTVAFVERFVPSIKQECLDPPRTRRVVDELADELVDQEAILGDLEVALRDFKGGTSVELAITQ